MRWHHVNENPLLVGTVVRALAKKGYKVAKDVATAYFKNAPQGMSPEQAADALIKSGVAVASAVGTKTKTVEGKRIPRKKGQPAKSKKHSDLYTDEDPKGTIHGLGFKDEATARSSVSKIRKSGRSHAHKIQAAVAMEQRAKAAGKSGPASIYRKYINSMKKKTKAKNEAAGVGIVTKQNATKDVPVGGEYMNVKKLHLGKGKPKKHPKKVSGSKTNVLFNLGMAESVNEVSAKDLSRESEIYVDMDGVLADFFGAWKKLIGTDWREIKDLDSALQKIRDKDDFWLNIPVTKNAMNLLSLIKGLKGKYNILSAPLPNDPKSEPHKREWIEKNLSAFPPSKIIITSNKAVHATQADGTPNILIDDFGKNIAKWEAAGGIGFKHKDHKFERTVNNLKAHMDKSVDEARGTCWHGYQQKGYKKKGDKMVPNCVKEDTQLNEFIFPAFRFGLATIKFLGRFIRRNPKTSIGTFSLPWTGPILAIFVRGLYWLSRYSIPVALGVVALYGGKKLYDALKDKDPDTITEKELEEILKDYVPKSDDDLKSINEAKMSKSSIKSIHKTADKIKDKPKAKKSIGNWAKERGMDPEGAIYAIATNMKKRKQGKKITGLGKESAENEGTLIPNPQRSILVKKNDGYDHYKLATHVANIKKMSPQVVNRNKQDIFIQFYGGEKEKEYMMKNLKRLGFGVQDADGYKDTHFDEDIEGSYFLKVNLENFADGKKPGRKGISKRVGIPKGASISQLEKYAKSKGEKGRMARWQLNMRRGKKK